MNKLENLGRVEKLRGHDIIRTSNLIEASIYLSLDCYIYSYHVEEDKVEYQITGEALEKARMRIVNKITAIGIARFIDSFNYMIEFEASLMKNIKPQPVQEKELDNQEAQNE